MTEQPYPLPANEKERLAALADFNLMDTPPEDEFDRLAELGSRLFKVPIVLISLIGEDRQFFKARVGFDPCETSREVSFCTHAIMQDDILFIWLPGPLVRELGKNLSGPVGLAAP